MDKASSASLLCVDTTDSDQSHKAILRRCLSIGLPLRIHWLSNPSTLLGNDMVTAYAGETTSCTRL